MKKLQDILKGFDLEETWDDGTKQYTVKQMHSVYYDLPQELSMLLLERTVTHLTA